ncbi:MAG: hypothetical protein M1831_005426 [Alyxoria varia]|nr:MAG: hypothetical protein M1831_005426 [Alyxoria varia]
MAAQSTTVLFVHGSWHLPAHMAPLIDKTKEMGFSAVCPLLPSCDVSSSPNSDTTASDRQTAPAQGWSGLDEDVNAVQSEIQRLLAQDKNVLIAAHSYGGVPATSALLPAMTAFNRSKAGLKGGVLGFLLINGYLVAKGESVVDFLQNKLAPCAEVHVCVVTTSLPLSSLSEEDLTPLHLYNDLSESEQERHSSMLVPQPLTPFMSPIKNPGYLYVPSLYIDSTNDQTCPSETHKVMIESARKQGASIDVVEMDASHSPHLSKTEEVSKLMKGFVDRLVTQKAPLSPVRNRDPFDDT